MKAVMKEYRFYFPYRIEPKTKKGVDLNNAFTVFADRVFARVGGYTVLDGVGVWAENKPMPAARTRVGYRTIYREPVHVVHVGLFPEDVEDIIKAFLFALRQAKEIAAYYVEPDGTAQCITL